MGLFNNILEKLGLKHPAAQAAPPKPVVTVSPPPPQVAQARPIVPPVTSVTPPGAQATPVRPFVTQTPPVTPATPKPPVPQVTLTTPPAQPSMARPFPADLHAPPPTPATSAAPAPMPVVDVVSKLEQMAATNTEKLDWKVSIVDLLKLLGLDSGYQARKELAIELGCPADQLSDSARMNTWLHKTVLQKIAENGGNIPKELLD